MTSWINGAIVAYSVLLYGMGIQSFFFPFEGSKPTPVSLIASAGIGTLMLISLLIWQKNPRVGRILSLVIAVLAMSRFLEPLFSKQQIYPAGTVVVASLLLIGLLGAGHMQASAAKKSGIKAGE